LKQATPPWVEKNDYCNSHYLLEDAL